MSSRRNQRSRRNGRKAPPQSQPRQGLPARVARRAAPSTNIVRVPNPRIVGLPAHHFDAFAPSKPQGLTFSVGPCTPVTGAARFTVNLPADSEKTLLCFQPGGGLDQAGTMRRTAPPVPPSASGTWSAWSPHNIVSTGFGTSASSSSPDTMMCTRGSIRVRNISPAADMAGAVHCLRVSTGIPQWGSALENERLAHLVEGHQRTVTMSGSQLSATYQWDCVPVSQDRYHQFKTPNYGIFSSEEPGLSTILMVFEHSSAKAQTYEVTICANYFARYSAAGPLANSAVCPPTVPLTTVNRSRDRAEQMGSIGKPILQAMGTAMGEKAMEVLPGLVGNLVNQIRPFPAVPPP
jgi:hypothetical protein